MTGERQESGRGRTQSRASGRLADAVDDAVLVELDTDGRIVTWNSGAESVTGWPTEEAVGSHLSMLYPEDRVDAGDPERALERARQSGRSETEGWHRRRDGSQYWARTTVTPLRTADGDLDGFALVVRDRTERKRVEDERELLADVSRAVADAESFASGVERALAAVCERTQWAYGEAWVPAWDGEGDGDHLEQLVAHAEDPALDPFLEASRSVTFPFGEGLPGRVHASGASEWIPDASAEPEEVFHRTELAAEVGLQAAFGVPIVTDDRVVAVLAFFLRERRRADEELVAVVTDVAADLGGLMARKQARESLERERSLLSRVFETSPVGLLVTDTDGTVVRANDQASTVFGWAGSEFAETPFVELATFETPDGEELPADELPGAKALESGEAVTDIELRVVRADGRAVWTSVSTAPIRTSDGATERVIVVVEDITDRKEREQSLRAFRKAVEQAGHSIYVTDTDGTIEYVNPTFEEVTGYSTEEAVGETPSILKSGEHDEEFYADLWETILDGEVWTGEVTNERRSGERYVVNQTIAPIVNDSGEIERFVAINDEITEQKRRERTLRRQRNSLERIKQLMESLRPINRELARAGTREDIDSLVCDRLAASEAYLFAWIGEYNAATGTITPQERAGVTAEFFQDRDLSVDDGDDIFARAVSDREVTARQEVATDPANESRRQRALRYGFQAQAAVPVVYGDTVFGVIGVYSARPKAFDEYERDLLRELGERVGHAINAAENRQLLHTDTVVELEFEVDDGAPLVAVAVECDCRFSLNNVTPASGTEQVWYLEVDGVDPDAVVAAFERRSDVTGTRVVKAHGETGVVEVTGRLEPVATLVEHGATVRTFDATADGATLVAEVAPQSDVEPLITDVDAQPGTVFVAKRTRDREVQTLALTKIAVEEGLTERQREALALAYHAGYFASPRDSTGEELAEVLGVAPPTFYRHVREAVRKVVGLLVDPDDAPTPPRSS